MKMISTTKRELFKKQCCAIFPSITVRVYYSPLQAAFVIYRKAQTRDCMDGLTLWLTKALRLAWQWTGTILNQNNEACHSQDRSTPM